MKCPVEWCVSAIMESVYHYEAVLIVVFCLLISKGLSQFCSNVDEDKLTMSANSTSVVEGTAIQITCQSLSESLFGVVWHVDSNEINTIQWSDGTCNNVYPTNTSLYEFGCVNDRTYTFVLKNVQRSSSGKKVNCHAVIQGSVYCSGRELHVLVSISSVSLTKPTSNTETVNENSPVLFQCEAHSGIPGATIRWYKDNRTPNDLVDDLEVPETNSRTENNMDGTMDTISTLNYVAGIMDNGVSIYCKANNTQTTIYTSVRKILLDVQYAPNSDPTIQGFSSGGKYNVIKNTNTSQYLTCEISGGNPLATLTWTCYDGVNTGNTTSQTVYKTITWNAGEVGRTCTCTANHILFTQQHLASVTVEILYPPSTPTFRIDTKNISGTNIKLIEGNTKSVKCISTGNPEPNKSTSFSWTRPSLVSTSGWTLNWVQGIQRGNSGQYTCNVQTTMVPSRGDQVPRTSSAPVNINVLYPPSTPTLSCESTNTVDITNQTIDAEVGRNFTINCSTEANPSAGYQWLGDITGNTVVPDKNMGNLTCKASNTMSPSDTNTAATTFRSGYVSFNINYAPENFSILYQPNSEQNTKIDHVVKLIHNDPLHLNCSAVSKPAAASYHWTGTLNSSSGVLNIQSVPKEKDGELICHAMNRVSRTCQTPATVERQNEKKINLDILYRPEVSLCLNASVVEDNNISLSCTYTVGNPSMTTFTWTRQADNVTVDTTQVFQLNSVQRTRTGFYEFTVKNTMSPTNRPVVNGIHKGQLYLDVFYGSSITKFEVTGYSGNNVTVSETDPIPFMCIVDSNPYSNIELKKNDVIVASDISAKLEHSLPSAMCSNTGLYKCSGSNSYTSNVPVQNIQIYVLCHPRRSPEMDNIQNNFTSALKGEVTLRFIALAYPVPKDYVWEKGNGSDWSSVTGQRYHVDVDGFQSSLRVSDILESDFGPFRVTVRNGIGQPYQEHFFIAAQGKPEKPRNFRHLKIGPSTIPLRWESGFNGGLEQTFYIQLKTATDSQWRNETNSIKDVTDEIMRFIPNTTFNHALSAESGTNYDIRIFAHNDEGSSNSSEITVQTPQEETLSPPTNMGPIIGGAVGGSFGIIIIAVIVIVLYKKRIVNKGKSNTRDGLIKGQNMAVIHKEESDDEEEVAENAMYQSGADVGRAAGTPADNLYATPMKANKQNVSEGTGDVYAVVNKPKKETKKEEKKKNKKKVKAKNNNADIYENAPTNGINKDKTFANSAYDENPYENPEKNEKPKRNVNKDGLIYADLEFADQAKGAKRLVIHGLDDMTEYADVDLTKKADILPDSDDEK